MQDFCIYHPKNVQPSVASSPSSSLDRIGGFPACVWADCPVKNLLSAATAGRQSVFQLTHSGLTAHPPIAPLFSHHLNSHQHAAAPFPPSLIFGLYNFLFSRLTHRTQSRRAPSTASLSLLRLHTFAALLAVAPCNWRRLSHQRRSFVC